MTERGPVAVEAMTYRVEVLNIWLCPCSGLRSRAIRVYTILVRMPEDGGIVRSLWQRGYRPHHIDERYRHLALHGLDEQRAAKEREYLASLGATEERNA